MFTDDTNKKIELTFVVKATFTANNLGEGFEEMMAELVDYMDEIEVTQIQVIGD